MIILITGASHTGKTLLAQRLLEKFKYPYLSIDHLKMGLIRSGNTGLTPKDDDIIGHESEIESRLIKEDCTINDLKQCNRWFIDTFGSAGEMVMLIEDDFGKALAGISSSLT
jgi:adenylate kinase family enzyme